MVRITILLFVLSALLLVLPTIQAQRIIEKLEGSDKKYFFAVGAGHMGGDEGLLSLLREQGYELTRIRP
jgi:uncharacterized protein YbaP (TraB family)